MASSLEQISGDDLSQLYCTKTEGLHEAPSADNYLVAISESLRDDLIEFNDRPANETILCLFDIYHSPNDDAYADPQPVDWFVPEERSIEDDWIELDFRTYSHFDPQRHSKGNRPGKVGTHPLECKIVDSLTVETTFPTDLLNDEVKQSIEESLLPPWKSPRSVSTEEPDTKDGLLSRVFSSNNTDQKPKNSIVGDAHPHLLFKSGVSSVINKHQDRYQSDRVYLRVMDWTPKAQAVRFTEDITLNIVGEFEYDRERHLSG